MSVDLTQMNLSLAGCGFLGSYHLGVCSCMKQFAPQIFRNKVSGASVGALVAAAFVCNAPLVASTGCVFDVSMKVRTGVLGPMTPDLNIMQLLYDSMASILPENAHVYANGRLHISVTRYADCKNVLLSQFDSKEDLLQALMCSCFIPLYCGYEPPEFHGVAYVDGGYSNNAPRLDDYTVTVAPFFGESDICPEDPGGEKAMKLMLNHTSIYMTLKNCKRLLRILFPGSPEMLKDLCQKGFNDGLRFLRDNGIIQCPDCSFRGTEINGNIVSERVSHARCKPIEYPMPQEICDQMDATVRGMNQGLGKRLLQNPVTKVLYYLNMPSIFTVRLSYSILSAIARKLHNKASSCVIDVSRDLLHYMRAVVQHPKIQSSIACHVDAAHVEYGDDALDEVTVENEISNGNATQSYETADTDVPPDLHINLPQRNQNSSLYLEDNRFLRTSVPINFRRSTSTVDILCQNGNFSILESRPVSFTKIECRSEGCLDNRSYLEFQPKSEKVEEEEQMNKIMNGNSHTL